MLVGRRIRSLEVEYRFLLRLFVREVQLRQLREGEVARRGRGDG